MPGRRRAVPPSYDPSHDPSHEEPEAEVPAADPARNPAPPVIGGAHARAPLSGQPRSFSPETSAPGAHSGARPAARPASRAPSLPSGPVLLPPAERPPARAPGSRRADLPTVVGPAPAHAPAGRRIATPNESIPQVEPSAPPRPSPARLRTDPPAVPPLVVDPPVEPTRVLAEALADPAEIAAPEVPRERRGARAKDRGRERTRTRGWLSDRSTTPVVPPTGTVAAPPAQEPPVETIAAPPAPEPGTTHTPVVEPVAEPEPAQQPRPRPARSRIAERIEQVQPARTPAGFSGAWTWLGVLLLACGGVLATRFNADLPDLVRQASGAVIAVGVALALAVRTGGRPIWAAGLTAALAVGAFAGDWSSLQAGASVGTGVMAACLAVMVTVPAATFAIAIRETLIATGIAGIGACGVLAFGDGARPLVDAERFDYAVLGLAVVGAFALVFRLGAGLHGLGRRGYAVTGSALIMLVLALAYSEALAQWGSRDLTSSLDEFRDSVRSALGAVPHPIVALLGYPALLWGVFMRARRRQGWWVCAFGVAATGPIATRLVSTDLSASSILLGNLYSLVIGVILGYAVIRAEQSFTGSHGRRARRDEEAVAHRPEPGRARPLH